MNFRHSAERVTSVGPSLNNRAIAKRHTARHDSTRCQAREPEKSLLPCWLPNIYKARTPVALRFALTVAEKLGRFNAQAVINLSVIFGPIEFPLASRHTDGVRRGHQMRNPGGCTIALEFSWLSRGPQVLASEPVLRRWRTSNRVVTQFGSYFVARPSWPCVLPAARARTPVPQIKLSHLPQIRLY